MNRLFSISQQIGYKFSKTVNTEHGRLSSIPNFIIGFSVFMSGNAILQAIADVVIEVAILAEFIAVKIPFRLEFLFLTMLSAVIAYLTLQGMKAGDLDVTRNTTIIGLIVESSLVFSDIVLIFTTTKDLLPTLMIRLPFMILTSINIAILSYIIIRRAQVKSARPNYNF